jgi:hypothetical protein
MFSRLLGLGRSANFRETRLAELRLIRLLGSSLARSMLRFSLRARARFLAFFGS